MKRRKYCGAFRGGFKSQHELFEILKRCNLDAIRMTEVQLNPFPDFMQEGAGVRWSYSRLRPNQLQTPHSAINLNWKTSTKYSIFVTWSISIWSSLEISIICISQAMLSINKLKLLFSWSVLTVQLRESFNQCLFLAVNFSDQESGGHFHDNFVRCSALFDWITHPCVPVFQSVPYFGIMQWFNPCSLSSLV